MVRIQHHTLTQLEQEVWPHLPITTPTYVYASFRYASTHYASTPPSPLQTALLREKAQSSQSKLEVQLHEKEKELIEVKGKLEQVSMHTHTHTHTHSLPHTHSFTHSLPLTHKSYDTCACTFTCIFWLLTVTSCHVFSTNVYSLSSSWSPR